MDLGEPIEIVEIELQPSEAPERGEPALPDLEPAPAEREEELIPAG